VREGGGGLQGVPPPACSQKDGPRAQFPSFVWWGGGRSPRCSVGFCRCPDTDHRRPPSVLVTNIFLFLSYLARVVFSKFKPACVAQFSWLWLESLVLCAFEQNPRLPPQCVIWDPLRRGGGWKSSPRSGRPPCCPLIGRCSSRWIPSGTPPPPEAAAASQTEPPPRK